MACSVPVFTTPAGLVSFDHVTLGEDIFICDESELVAKVNESLFDVDLMELVGKNARCTVETHYSTAANSEKFIKVIERLSTESNAPAVRYSTQANNPLGRLQSATAIFDIWNFLSS